MIDPFLQRSFLSPQPANFGEPQLALSHDLQPPAPVPGLGTNFPNPPGPGQGVQGRDPKLLQLAALLGRIPGGASPEFVQQLQAGMQSFGPGADPGARRDLLRQLLAGRAGQPSGDGGMQFLGAPAASAPGFMPGEPNPNGGTIPLPMPDDKMGKSGPSDLTVWDNASGGPRPIGPPEGGRIPGPEGVPTPVDPEHAKNPQRFHGRLAHGRGLPPGQRQQQRLEQAGGFSPGWRKKLRGGMSSTTTDVGLQDTGSAYGNPGAMARVRREEMGRPMPRQRQSGASGALGSGYLRP
jgi:hypothetical protein